MALLLLLLLVPVALFVLAGMTGLSRMTRVDVAGLSSGGPTHFLVVGSDSREGLTREEQNDLSVGRAGGNRTDTIFVLTVGGGRAAMLAYPRDLLVTRCDGTEGRINAAVAIDGPSCLVETVERTSGIGIDHYVEINFGGFRDLVDAVGGVELCLPDPISDEDAGIDLPAGCQTLDGKQALGYVRVRKIDNDLFRIERQQQFMRALAGEIATPATFVNPWRLFDVAGSAGASLTTDSDFGLLDGVALARGLRAMQTGKVVTDTIPTTNATVGGAAVLRATDEAAAVQAAHADGSILDQARPGPTPDDLRVLVRNGTTIPGLASRVADELEAAGITVTGTNNAEPVSTTTLSYPPDLRSHAELLDELSPIPLELVEDEGIDQLVLVLGPDAQTD